MGQVLHGSATTTEAIRRAIQHSQESLRTLAGRYGINQSAKRKKRTFVGGVDPQIRPVALDRAGEKRPHFVVDLGTQPRDLALGDTSACRKSSTHIQMMESAKKWRGHNATNGIYCSRHRRVLVD